MDINIIEGYVLSSTRPFLTVTVSHADLYIFSDDVDGDMDTDGPKSGNGKNGPKSGNGGENPYDGKLT